MTELSYANEKIDDTQADLIAETLTGDLRDALLGRVHIMQKPWQQMSEDEQTDIAEQFERAATHLVRRAVGLIAANGRKTIVAHLDKVEIKDGIKISLSLPKLSDAMVELGSAQGSTVLLIAATEEYYQGERAPANIDKDQPSLLVDDEEML